MINLYLVQLALRKNTYFHSWYRLESLYNCEYDSVATRAAINRGLTPQGEQNGAGNYRLV